MDGGRQIGVELPRELAGAGRRVAVYARISTTRQAEQDLSLPD